MGFNEHGALFMIVCMALAGFASTMNNWIDKLDDFRFSINDFYMIGLMTGWTFFFMGLFTFNLQRIIGGLIGILLFFGLIRNQTFITEMDYLRGMIPHHSMAVMMSKRLEKKPNTISHLLDQIIQSQEKEIIIMKNYLDGAA
jgi:hypothetical protein